MCSRRRRSLRGWELYVGDVWVKVILGLESWRFRGRWGVRRLGPRSRFLSRMHGHRGPEPRSVRAWSARSGTAQSADPTPGAVCSGCAQSGRGPELVPAWWSPRSLGRRTNVLDAPFYRRVEEAVALILGSERDRWCSASVRAREDLAWPSPLPRTRGLAPLPQGLGSGNSG